MAAPSSDIESASTAASASSDSSDSSWGSSKTIAGERAAAWYQASRSAQLSVGWAVDGAGMSAATLSASKTAAKTAIGARIVGAARRLGRGVGMLSLTLRRGKRFQLGAQGARLRPQR